MIRLTEQQVLDVHSRMIEMTGGSDGVRDRSLLDSALNAPFQTFDRKENVPIYHFKSSVCGRKQTYRNSCHVDFP